MLVAFVLGLTCGFVGSIPIAGPAAVLIVERALSGHGRAALGVAAGTAAAEAGYALLAFLGMTAALSRFPWMLSASRIVGAIILIGLGLYFALGPRRQPSDPASNRRARARDGLWLGLVVTCVNPTLIVTWSAVVTILHSTGFLRVEPLDAFPFGLGVCAGVAGWFAVLIAILEKLRSRVRDSMMEKIVRALGWILLACGAALLVKLGLDYVRIH
jgi:threonine/homoserine/homoserine lactone efflux protein